MRGIRLSICIPVYNFGAFIGATLDSIISQATENIEIVIVDGASTDNTAEVIASFQRTFPRLRYHRREQRGGIDRDMAKTVELAQGEYCWLFSGDDIMLTGALARVLDKISSGADLMLCESILCDFNMQPIVKHDMLDAAADEVFDLGNTAERLRYFQRAKNTAAFFSFCGALIFKRSVWNLVDLNLSFVGSCWAHAARFFEILPRGLTVKYISEPCLAKRGENDSFLDKGLVNRIRIAIAGYHNLADTFFGSQSVEAFHIRRVIRHEFKPRMLLFAKLECHKKKLVDDRVLLDHLAEIAYCDPLFINHVNLFLYKFAPLFLYQPASAIYRGLKKLYRILMPLRTTC